MGPAPISAPSGHALTRGRDMNKSLYFRAMWIWCRLCYHLYMWLPASRTHKSLYGQFTFWLLGYAGAYAHSDLSSFHLCDFFYRNRADQSAAWDRYLAGLTPADGGAKP